MNFFQLIYSDFRRYRTLKSNTFRTLFFTQGFTASWVFRLSNLVYEKIRFPIIRPILRLMTLFLLKGIEITTGIYLPEGCHVGPGLYIGHFGGIIINGESVIGSNCNLSHGVTLGSKNGGGNAGVPRLGNRVYVGPHAILIGGIDVGDDAAIGAGAVVTHSVPARAVVVGNPAHIISYKGSFEYITYDGMEQDPERNASLAIKKDGITVGG